MKIAILGWGSLIWNPKELNTAGEWKKDGPLLPIEFARISKDGRLTLVIRPASKMVKTLYIDSAFSDFDAAILNLQVREECLLSSIGYVNFNDNSHNIKRIPVQIKETLVKWNVSKKYDAIIWTDLGQNFKNSTSMVYTIHNVKRYIAGLKPQQYQGVKNYIFNTPEQIKTQLRKQLTEFINLRNEVSVTLKQSASFFNVPRNKLLNYYPEIVANSSAQFRAANQLASAGDYGMAMSHLLISTEEMIKALVVVMDAQGFDFRKVKGMDIFFKNHEIRFFISFITFIFTLFADDGKKIFQEMKNNPAKTKELATLLEDKAIIFKKLQIYFIKKLIIIKQELHWFSQAEAFRQNGFYVDSKGNLVSPLQYTDKDYNETRLRIEKINTAIQATIDALLTEDETLKAEIENTKATFHNEKFYTLIENELAARRTGKETFFEKFQMFLFGIVDAIKDPPPRLDDFT